MQKKLQMNTTSAERRLFLTHIFYILLSSMQIFDMYVENCVMLHLVIMNPCVFFIWKNNEIYMQKWQEDLITHDDKCLYTTKPWLMFLISILQRLYSVPVIQLGLLCKLLTHFPVISYQFFSITIHRYAEDDESRRKRLNAAKEYAKQKRYVLTTVLYNYMTAYYLLHSLYTVCTCMFSLGVIQIEAGAQPWAQLQVHAVAYVVAVYKCNCKCDILSSHNCDCNYI